MNLVKPPALPQNMKAALVGQLVTVALAMVKLCTVFVTVDVVVGVVVEVLVIAAALPVTTVLTND